MEGASNDATAQMTAIGKTIQILFCLPRSVVNVNLTQHSTISVAHKQSLGYKIRKSKLEAISSTNEFPEHSSFAADVRAGADFKIGKSQF